MALIVQKYGGTSVGSVERIEAVADKIARFRDNGDDVVVVVSAMSGETNRLTALAKDIMDYPTPREMDVLLSTGEQVTIALLSMALEKRGYGARSFTGGQVKILTCETHTKARIREIDGTRFLQLGKRKLLGTRVHHLDLTFHLGQGIQREGLPNSIGVIVIVAPITVLVVHIVLVQLEVPFNHSQGRKVRLH